MADYNVRALSDDIKLSNLEEELENINWDIIGISEMRRPNSILELANGNVLYCSRNNKKERGVGFLVKKHLQGSILNFRAISERLAVITIQFSKRYLMKIIQVYAPTSLSSQEDLDEFYDDLNTELDRPDNASHFATIMGDFNAKVGRGDEDCMGNFGYGDRNDRGEDLVNFAVSRGYKIMNTCFKKKVSRRWTCTSSNFETFNEIDYVQSNNPQTITNIDTITRVNTGSDHRMLRCQIKINTKMERQAVPL